MTMLPVPSRTVAAVGYDVASGVLRADYRDGRAVEFSAVPPEVVAEVLFGESVGAAIANGVRARGYACRRVEAGGA